MAAAPINLEDFTCSICREIFENPVSLPCSHNYCKSCINGLKKPSSSPVTDILPASSASLRRGSVIYTPKIHEADQCYVCAMCRKESLGYLDCRDLEVDLKTIESSCPHCSKSLLLRDVRKHVEKCHPPKTGLGVDAIKKAFTPDVIKKLSEPQAKALEKARNGENRSTFQCPYCARSNFTVQHLRTHMEKHHLNEHPSRVCPICASMPWGDKNRVSANVYAHILNRHRFDYDMYVNFEQDDEAMLAEVIAKSMEIQ